MSKPAMECSSDEKLEVSPPPRIVAEGKPDVRHPSVTESMNKNHNNEAKIANPLSDIPYEALMAQVEIFAQQKDLMEAVDLLKKGALIAQDPITFENLQCLSEEEKECLRYEVSHRWRHPAMLYFMIVLCSIGAAVQGWDQTGSNGANLAFPKALGIGHGEDLNNPNHVRDSWLVGLVNAGPYIGASLVGCWLADPCNFYLGRRGTIFISAIFCLITPIGGAFTQSWPELFATRFLMGIGMGLKATSVPIFAAENSPARIRGALVMGWQMWTSFGIFLGNCANLAVYRTGAIAWRLQIGSAFIPAVPLVFGILFCPESARWLMKKNRYPEAYKSLCRLRFTELQAARDLYYIHCTLEVEKLIKGDRDYLTRFGQLFTIPRVRRATLAAFIVMIAQQMCGINIIAFFSSTIFRAVNATEFESLVASFGFGLVNWLFAFPAIWTIDTFGRRTLLLFTFPNMAWTLLAAGLCFLIPNNQTAHIALVALFVYLFAVAYSPGEGPVPFTYSAEVFPISHREVGMGFAVATNLFWAAVLAISFPALLAQFTVTGAFGFYAGLNVFAFVLIFLFMPETKQRTLEELDYIFAVPTSKFVRYQVGTAAPWWIKKWLLWRRKEELPSLYEHDRSIDFRITEGGGQRYSIA